MRHVRFFFFAFLSFKETTHRSGTSPYHGGFACACSAGHTSGTKGEVDITVGTSIIQTSKFNSVFAQCQRETQYVHKDDV